MDRWEGQKLCTWAILLFAAVESLNIGSTLAQGSSSGSSMFQCHGGYRIQQSWVCDGHNDCPDGLDEQNCGSGIACMRHEFACQSNSSCISETYHCDGHRDCDDGSDEQHCSNQNSRPCRPSEFQCNDGRCIRTSFRCDNENDCRDGSDEDNCPSCGEHQFQCDNEGCIPSNWECDGESDCRDSSDEMDCGPLTWFQCGFGMFNCTNGGCVNINLVCDGDVDCKSDESDEEDCPALVCRDNQFKCPDVEVGCIKQEWVCDGDNDCGDGSDEVNCVNQCTEEQYVCITTGGCVNRTQVCDGQQDCQDGSDEFRCSYPPPPAQCDLSQFPCLDRRGCIAMELLCDNRTQCDDGSDEHAEICALSSPGVNECDVNNGGCEHSCHNTSNGFFCRCHYGYILDTSNRRSCIDYDECSIPGKCSQLCHNTNGSYFCECVEGYFNLTHGSCKAEGPPARLMFVNRVDIQEVSLDGSYTARLIKHLHNAIAIDFHYRLGYIYWTDLSQDVIKRAWMNGTNITTVVSTGLKGAGGLAVDWVSGKLYWSDAEKVRIEVADLEGRNKTVMFSEGLDRPRAITLEPTLRLMFWTDWGSHPKIERASMDGKGRAILHEKHLFWPNALTIDYATHALYWADAKLRVIESSHVDGSGRRLVIADVIRHPFAMTLFEDRLYWTDWEKKSVLSTSKGIGRNVTEIQGDLLLPMDIHAIHPVRQPEAPNPCVNNGGCSYLCLLSAEDSQGYSCVCPTGIKLAPNGRDCQPLDTFILFARFTDIRRISLDVPQLIDVTLPLRNLSRALAVDWDSETNQVYWSDVKQDTISVAGVDGSNQHIVIDRNLKSPGGIAIDWVTRKLYWTEAIMDRIEVSDLDGGNRSILVFSNLDKPRDIVVYPDAGRMFWTDWGRYPKIETASLDGSQRATIVTTNLTFPNGLALDYERNLLYWVNAGEDPAIEYANFDGRNRKVLLNSNIRHPFGLALYGDWVYWTDWLLESLERANKTAGLQRSIILDNLDNPMDVHIFHRNRTQQVRNPCTTNNGGCSHLCLTRPSKRRSNQLEAVCACPIGHSLMEDEQHCNPVIDNYLLFPTPSNARQISLDVRYIADTHLPIRSLRDATSVDIDIVTDEIYWTNRLEAKIYKAPMSGNQPPVEVINLNLITPESIAIDWISRNIYWVDSGTRRIEVASLNGTSRRVLFSTNVVLPTSIAVDLQTHTMYWADAGDGTSRHPAKIEKANMDGYHRHTIIPSKLGQPRSIAIDNSLGLEGKIYWTDSYHQTIEFANLDGTHRTAIISLKDINGASPYGVAVFGSHVYWTDMNFRTVTRARKDDGSDQYRVWTGGDEDQLGEIRVIRKKDLLNKDNFDIPCDSDQGCSDLCLPNQNIEKYACACPTGISLTSDDATCRKAPRRYLLLACRYNIRRISMDTQIYNDVILLSGLRNAIAIDYLMTSAEEGMMFFTNQEFQSKILSAHLNGTGLREVVTTGLKTPDGLAVDWVAHNLYWSDTHYNHIEVAKLDGSLRKVLINTSLHQPRAIALHPHLGLMFWTDWGSNPKIERARMDGSERVAIVNSHLRWPNGITIDYGTSRIYWVDAGRRTLESALFSGGDRRVIVSNQKRNINHPFGVAFYGGFVFWSDWHNHSIFRADVDDQVGGVDQFRIQGNLNLPMELRFVSSVSARPGELMPYRRPGPCSFNNGGCNQTQLCLAVNSTLRRCACPDRDILLATTNTSCVETVGTPPPPPPPTTPPPTSPPSTLRLSSMTTPPPTSPNGPPTDNRLPPLPPSINPPSLEASPNQDNQGNGSLLSIGVAVTLVLVALIGVVSVVIVIVVAVIFLKRQYLQTERQRAFQRVAVNNPSGCINKLDSAHAVIPKPNNLIPQANNATVQKNKGGNTTIASCKEQNIFVEEPEVFEIPAPTQQRHRPSPPDSPPLKPPASLPPKCPQKPPAPLPPTEDKCLDKETPPRLPPKGQRSCQPSLETKVDNQEQKQAASPTDQKKQNNSPRGTQRTVTFAGNPSSGKSPAKNPEYDHLEIKPGISSEYDHLELKASPDVDDSPEKHSSSGTEDSSL